MIKLRATITWTFEVKPEWYEPGRTPEEMAKIESAADPVMALEAGMRDPDFSYTVSVMQED